MCPGNVLYMVGLRCVDGSYLTVTPRVCADSVGVPYEVTLELYRDGSPYGVVGERCGHLLARLAEEVVAARAATGGRWADPDDRFPEINGELFAFRYRTRTAMVAGELRCHVRMLPTWLPTGRAADHHPPAGRFPPTGRWHLRRRAVVEAWGHASVGLRAVLTSGELAAFLGGLVAEAESGLGGALPAGT